REGERSRFGSRSSLPALDPAVPWPPDMATGRDHLLDTRTVDVDGPVAYVEWPSERPGGGGPTFVCVHGLGGSHVNWMLVGPRLAAHGRVLALDLAGFGL